MLIFPLQCGVSQGADVCFNGQLFCPVTFKVASRPPLNWECQAKKQQNDEKSSLGRIAPNIQVSLHSSSVKSPSEYLEDNKTNSPYRPIPVCSQISEAAALLWNHLQSPTRLPAKLSLAASWPRVWCLPVRLLQTALRWASHSRDDPVIGRQM